MGKLEEIKERANLDRERIITTYEVKYVLNDRDRLIQRVEEISKSLRDLIGLAETLPDPQGKLAVARYTLERL